MKINENHENPSKLMKINQNLSKSMKITNSAEKLLKSRHRQEEETKEALEGRSEIQGGSGQGPGLRARCGQSA